MKRKICYQSKSVPRIPIMLSGEVYLRYVDDGALEKPSKGDLMVYPYEEALNGARLGRYEETGFSGYFKVDVFDGKKWCLVLLNDIFPERENHFSKKERPIDTYALCKPILQNMKEKTLLRTYREHYAPEGGEEVAE